MTAGVEVLVEGVSDVPVITEILQRRFGLTPDRDFRVHPHQGRGKLPTQLDARPDPKHRGLLDQLPSKLKGYARSLPPNNIVLVLLDADGTAPEELLGKLSTMLQELKSKPERVLFQLAVEEIESWFIADWNAVRIW
jgi:hypothetical protein